MYFLFIALEKVHRKREEATHRAREDSEKWWFIIKDAKEKAAGLSFLQEDQLTKLSLLSKPLYCHDLHNI